MFDDIDVVDLAPGRFLSFDFGSPPIRWRVAGLDGRVWRVEERPDEPMRWTALWPYEGEVVIRIETAVWGELSNLVDAVKVEALDITVQDA